MQFRNDAEKQWWRKQWKAADDHTLGVLRYAERLASIIEAAEHDGPAAHLSDDVFLEASFAADASPPKQVTILMYSYAIMTLVKAWGHGDALKAWHNKRWASTGIPFRSENGLTLPCSIQNKRGQHAVLIGVYAEIARMDQAQLERLAAAALQGIEYPHDYRA